MSVDALATGTLPSVDPATRAKARRLRELAGESVLVLPNAWDAGSAAVIASAGAPAVATTSGGVSWSLGHGDGQHGSRAAMVAAAGRIVAAVDVPVTVDAEGGYGPGPQAVADTVRALIAVGAVGANLEDSQAVGGPLFPAGEQAARLRAARAAATAADLPEFLVNARTDVFLFGIGEPAGRLDEVLSRAADYAAAGADSLFVPGLLDLDVLTELCARSPLPVNAMLLPGGPSVPALAACGVRRISAGTALAQAAYTAAHRAAVELLGPGTLDALAGPLGFGELDGLF
ncbi:isocitrate lyase/PEP mutase family protein [Kitasatospora sp. NBC_01266]|uniref:isocitrate lyase/PEP mutase family protein n=1 Tax=Kitasatospora sp. NBC_01266 TaxID=2903572 RepID=UPI002E2EBD83|nr:isocitrate lyase/phosphoenolpyruvate mutase family protein [Kitasatospora sp. NBC_01266]